MTPVGKRSGKLSTAQRFINKQLIDAAHKYQTVVRLKGGDPMLFGRAQEEIDALIVANLATGWSLDRIDRLLRQILRAGVYELIARADIPVGSIINEYLDVAEAFYAAKEKKFVNGLLDAIAKAVRK